MILGTAGHIDHGKTALVRALTGVDTDRLPEEKRRGITIDLGFAPLVIEGAGTIGIVDVPGHEAFIRTMLAGASGIDIALLVVAADEGVMPQTREHLQILSLLAIPQLVIALTKADLVDNEWLSLAVDDVASLLADTSYAGSEIIPVSSLTGAGITELRKGIRRAADAVESVQSATNNRGRTNDLFRMPVDRAFTIKGTGTVVTGTVWSGSIDSDSGVTVFPPGVRSRVRGIQHHSSQVKTARPGERVALALADLDVADVKRGSVVVAGGTWIPTTRAEAHITLTGEIVRDIGPRTRLRFHIGTSDVSARLSRARVYENAAPGEFVATVVLKEPLLLRSGDRFVLRLPSPETTIGGGRIIDPLPAHRRRKSIAPNEAPLARFERIVAEAGMEGIPIDVLPIRLGVTPAEAAELARRENVLEVRGRLHDRAAIDDLEITIEREIRQHAENFPLEPGVKLRSVRALARVSDELIAVALDALVTKGRIEVHQSLAKPAGWRGSLSDKQRDTAKSVMQEIAGRNNEPPAVSELQGRFGKDVPDLLRYLERSGELVRVSEDRYYSPQAVATMVEKLRDTLVPGQVYSPTEIKEVLGMSRKYLIPFLEFCDLSGVTDRRAEGRVIGEKALSRRLKEA